MAEKTVLVIEDRRENIVFLANNVLRPYGYDIITAMDGQRGLERAMQDKPDLIIMDVNLPHMNGLQVLEALRRQENTCPVVVSTFYDSEQVRRTALRGGRMPLRSMLRAGPGTMLRSRLTLRFTAIPGALPGRRRSGTTDIIVYEPRCPARPA